MGMFNIENSSTWNRRVESWSITFHYTDSLHELDIPLQMDVSRIQKGRTSEHVEKSL
jgi:hypothetical protein